MVQRGPRFHGVLGTVSTAKVVWTAMRVGLLAMVVGCGGSTTPTNVQPTLSIEQQITTALANPADTAAKMLADIAIGAKQKGNPDGAKKALALAVEQSEKDELAENPMGRVNALSAVAKAQHEVLLLDRKAAKDTLQKAASAADKIEQPEVKVTALIQVADAQVAMKSNAQALDTLKKAKETAGGLTDPLGKTLSLCKIAQAYQAAGNTGSAEAAATDAEAATAAISTDGLEGEELDSLIRVKSTCMANVGATQAKLKKDDAAKAAFDESESLARKVTDPLKQANAMYELGEQLIAAGRMQQAGAILEEGRQTAKKGPASLSAALIDKIIRAQVRVQGG